MNKYEQIINYYRQQIVDKVLKPGDQLPNEIEIAQAFKVSRMTANKALNILAQPVVLLCAVDRVQQDIVDIGVFAA